MFERCNNLVFPFKLPFFLLEIAYNALFFFNFIFKLLDLMVFLLSYSIYHIILVFFKNNLDLSEVGLDDLSHTAEALKKGGNLVLHVNTEEAGDFRFHRPYYHFDLLLVSGVLSNQCTLKFHNCFNDQL